MTRDQGLVLVTGPTGSGKTTTLYAFINSINQDDINIHTIEDPIEYEIEGINQTQTDEFHGIDFATGLRALLRADPDVILVGESRDEETATAAINAALTGHLVLTTLHANDSLRAVSRLISMNEKCSSIISINLFRPRYAAWQSGVTLVSRFVLV